MDTEVRDIYYLTLPEGTMPQMGSLDITLYDSFTQETVLFAGEDDLMTLLPLEFVQ